MIISKQQTFSDGQVVTADANSTNVIDLGATGTVLGGSTALTRDIGKGNKIPVVVEVTAVSGTNPTLTVSVIQDTAAAMSSETAIQDSQEITAAGRVTIYVLPEQITERYIGLDYNVSGTSPSFTIDAFIPMADQEGLLGGVDD